MYDLTMTEMGRARQALVGRYFLTKYYVKSTGCLVIPVLDMYDSKTNDLVMTFLRENSDWMFGFNEDGAVGLKSQSFFCQPLCEIE